MQRWSGDHPPPPSGPFWRAAGPWQIACAFLLGVVGTLLWTRPDAGASSVALAQTPALAGARGVYAFSGQLDANRQGVFMLDIEQGTLWVYELESAGGVRKLRLAAARSWLFDRYLRNFNCAEPTYQQVQELVARERAQLSTVRGAGLADEPTSNARPLPDLNADNPGEEPN